MTALPKNTWAMIPETQPEICDSASRKFEMDPEILITKLSFIHIRKILPIPDSMFDQLDHYRDVVYEYVYSHYKEAA